MAFSSQAACGNLWAAYVSVLATLRLEFARTTALVSYFRGQSNARAYDSSSIPY